MKCYRCNVDIAKDEERDWHGRTLCEDCYMDALSPAKACDPWAVYAAKNTPQSGEELNDIQAKIIEILDETGGITPEALAGRLKIKPEDLQREIATLRHMEKTRGEKRGDKVFLVLW